MREGSWVRLDPLEFFLLWTSLGLGEPPAVLGVAHAGRTRRARDGLIAAADRTLGDRGLGTVGRPDPDLAALLHGLAEGKLSVDLVADDYHGLGVYGRHDAVVAGLLDGEIRLGGVRAANVVVTLLETLEPLQAGPGVPANVSAADYRAACEAGERGGLGGFTDTLRRAGLRINEVSVLVTAVTRRTGGGHFGGTLIRDGHAHRGPGMVNWVNTPDGRYAFRQAGDWVTVTPLDPRRFRTMAEELVDAVRAL